MILIAQRAIHRNGYMNNLVRLRVWNRHDLVERPYNQSNFHANSISLRKWKFDKQIKWEFDQGLGIVLI